MAKRKKLDGKIIGICTLIIIGVVSLLYSKGIFDFNPVGDTVTDSSTYVDFIDCGQGDSALIYSEGDTALVDVSTKEGGDLVVQHLKERGIRKIDHLILTHPHEDHIGGALAVINSFEIGMVYMAEPTQGTEPTTSVYINLLKKIDEEELKITFVEIGDTFRCGEFDFEFLGPIKAYKDLNDQSIVLRGEFDKVSILFKGDQEIGAEQELLEEYGNRLKSTIYAVGHHGSRTASSEDLLRVVQPKYAVVSCGEGNSYGHPHDEALERLKKTEAAIYRTDLDGTVTFYIDGNSIEYKEK